MNEIKKYLKNIEKSQKLIAYYNFMQVMTNVATDVSIEKEEVMKHLAYHIKNCEDIIPNDFDIEELKHKMDK